MMVQGRDGETGELVEEVPGTTPESPVSRVAATPAALALIARLVEQHGPVMFHQSGGCCDGSSPMCYPVGDFLLGDRDVLLGFIGTGTAVYIGGAQFEYWSHTHLTLDVVRGRGAGFSLEAPEGFRFLTRSRLFTDDESAALLAAGEPHRGPLE
ncbi:MAG: hypothetical protein JWL64_2064 [Frankiales bacterium]|nr:hypothetical protein [Frankiales bacterium]